MSVTKAQMAATARYDKEHTRKILMKLNKTTDADILEKLDSIGNKQGYIKACIRKDLTENK